MGYVRVAFGLRVVGCGLWVWGAGLGRGLRVAGYGLRVAGYGLLVVGVGFGAWVMGCGLWVASYRCWVWGVGYGLWVAGIGYGHGHGYRLRLHARPISIRGTPIPLSHFVYNESLIGCYAIFLTISYAYSDPLPKQQLVIAPRDYTAETLAKLSSYRNYASIYRNPRVPLFSLCHRRGRALLT
jgi:hypothetical protein